MPNRIYRYMKIVHTPSVKGKGKYTDRREEWKETW